MRSWLLVTDDAVASVERADEASVSGSWLILSRWQVVIFEPREVIVRRVAADRVIAAVELPDERPRAGRARTGAPGRLSLR